MTDWKNTIKVFALAIWADLILNKNKLGRRRNAFLIRQDVMCLFRRVTNGNHFRA